MQRVYFRLWVPNGLRRLKSFGGVEDGALQPLLDTAKPKVLPPCEVLFDGRERIDGVHFVLRGVLNIAVAVDGDEPTEAAVQALAVSCMDLGKGELRPRTQCCRRYIRQRASAGWDSAVGRTLLG